MPSIGINPDDLVLDILGVVAELCAQRGAAWPE
jgi:hypothetical protein